MNRKSIIASILIILFLVALTETIQFVFSITWSPTENRLTTDTYADNMPTVTETSDRKIWVVWQKRVLMGDSLYYVTSSNQGASWSSENNLTRVPVTYVDTAPSMIQLMDGTLFLVWSSSRTGNYELFYKTSSNLGASWSPDTQLTFNFVDDLRPSIVQLSNGTLFLVWSSARTGNYDLCYKTNSGTGWPFLDTQLTFNSANDQGPSATQTKDGKIWVTWTSVRTGNYEIFYKTCDGTAWTDDTNLTLDADLEDSSPSILQIHDQTIYVFWSAGPPTPSGTNDVYYKYSTDNGANWSTAIEFTTDQYEDLWPAATQARNHRLWVVWTSNRADQTDGNFDVYYRMSLIHNIAVTKVTSSHTAVFRGESVTINATFQNQGDYSETFTATCYANSTVIQTQPVTISSRASTWRTFTWDTTSFTSGNYTVKTQASIVEGETQTQDSTLNDGTVHVRLLGDVDNNGTVDILDLTAMNNAYSSLSGSSNWNANADMNKDDKIDIFDLTILGENWNKTG